jgi:hypothetical protein
VSLKLRANRKWLGRGGPLKRKRNTKKSRKIDHGLSQIITGGDGRSRIKNMIAIGFAPSVAVAATARALDG